MRKTAQDEFEEITKQATVEGTPNKDEEKDFVPPLNGDKGKELPPYPKDPAETVDTPTKEGKGKGASEKPLPGVEKEPYEWDADIF